MVRPDILLNAIADKLRLIPELANIPIYTYDESYPYQSDIALAIWKLKAPSLLVVWRGSSPGSKARIEVWRHSYSVIIRSNEDSETAANPASYFEIWAAISNGKPADGTGCSFRGSSVHESVFAMETPSIVRQTLYVTAETRLDYHEVQIVLTERGDY